MCLLNMLTLPSREHYNLVVRYYHCIYLRQESVYLRVFFFLKSIDDALIINAICTVLDIPPCKTCTSCQKHLRLFTL